MKWSISLLLMSLFSCGKAQQVESGAYNLMLKALLKHNVPELSVQQADSLVKTGQDVVFIDTREQREYEVSHIKNAIWVGYEEFDMARLQGIAKDTKIITYCSVGARSEHIAHQLIDAGYTDVSNLYGSIFEWVNQGLPVYTGNNTPTPQVHAYNKKWGIWLNKGEKVYE